MAKVAAKRPENVPGLYYVDDQCISCGACWAVAPDFFATHEVHTYAYMKSQPRTSSEQSACQEALERCPVAAIGLTTESEETPDQTGGTDGELAKPSH